MKPTPASEDDGFEAIRVHVAHQVACPCCTADRLGRIRSGTGCQEERRLWAAARVQLYGERRGRD
jgi:hypothetical protein